MLEKGELSYGVLNSKEMQHSSSLMHSAPAGMQKQVELPLHVVACIWLQALLTACAGYRPDIRPLQRSWACVA